MDSSADFHQTLAGVIPAVEASGEERYAVPLRHGTLEVGLYAPRGADDQEPHTQDEVYVVARGSGQFVNGDRRHPFSEGDLLFVPAGVVHRFEDFSDDLLVWVIFYGPEGGEARPLGEPGPALLR